MSLVLEFFHSRTVARARARISLVSRGLPQRHARYVARRPPSGIPKQRRCVGEDPAQEGPVGPLFRTTPPTPSKFSIPGPGPRRPE